MNKESLMQTCVNIALQNLGRTGKNPSVGALIWSDGKIATGVTGIGGTPHAETSAIANAKNLGIDCKGSTLFVTLEPCSHFGKTPPCVDAIIAAKIEQVIIGMQDPDMRVNGNGIAKLVQAEIKVETLHIKEIEKLYREYNIFKIHNRPYVCLKIASSLDGKIAISSGISKWITSNEARLHTNFLRSRFGGILIGANTYRADSPSLTCRIEDLEEFSPKKFIASSKEIDGYISVSGTVREMIGKIYANGVQSVLVEGGAHLITQFIKENIFDEVILVQAPVFLGNDGKSCVDDLNLTQLPLTTMDIKTINIMGNNIITQLLK